MAKFVLRISDEVMEHVEYNHLTTWYCYDTIMVLNIKEGEYVAHNLRSG